MKDLEQCFKQDKVEFYRGDSFQVFIKDAEKALLKCVKSRLLAILYTEQTRIDIRLSVSIGVLRSDVVNMGSNMEEIFVNSGRQFDKFQNSSRRLYINCGNTEKDFTYEIIAEYVDSLLDRLTARQAEVLYYLLSENTQAETAGLLKLTPATISNHVRAARYEEIKSMLNKFKILTNQLKDGK
ncbi:hypothetical protein EWM62_03865 [Mucilaginibacter terrigena]|uniref:Uncharacterized protein n=1 Tax=Mucilaginibacter terrigena TaxID=2492395 RepID=A0A4Q5LNY4_9SPHI|nr:hypothetical protein [Mucilaginibacter terrigena]RYU91084.1 hypothetical protein EWM62_03865 [Mucilaginibacter terrigena]